MNNLEKMLFLEMTNKQFVRQPDEEYYKTYTSLTESESEKFIILSQELHDIWNYINSHPVLNVHDSTGVDTIQDFNEKVNPVSEILMKISNDFGLTLQDQMTDDVKNAIIKIFGLEYYLKNFVKP